MWSKTVHPLVTEAEAYNFCLDRLALRDHSSLELRQKLAERQCPEAMQAQVLAKLRQRYFVDDTRCAEHVLEAWRRKKFYGRQYLRLMLQKRMIPQKEASLVLESVATEEEIERAEAFARSVLAKLHRKYPGAEQQRKGKAALARMLASRGFGSGAIAGTLSLWNENE